MTSTQINLIYRAPGRIPSWGLSPSKRKSSAALMAYWVRQYRADQIQHHPTQMRTHTLKAQILAG